MTTLLGFIQLLLVLVPLEKPPHLAATKEQKKISAPAAETNQSPGHPLTHHAILPFRIGLLASLTTPNNNKAVAAIPSDLHNILFIACTAGIRAISNKPFRPRDLYILYCRLKSDC